MNRVVFLMVAAALAISPCGAAAELQPSEDLGHVHVESFDYVWHTIRDRHWDPDMGGLDWEAVRDELRPRVANATTTSAARAVLEEMISRLGMSHYAILPAEIYDEIGLPDGQGSRDGTTGIDVRVIGGRALVTSVADDSPAAQTGVRPGWVVVRIGEDDLAPILERVAAEFAGSLYEDLALAGAVLARLGGPVGTTRTVEFLDDGDRRKAIELTLAGQRGRRFQAGYLPPFHIWIEARRIEGSIGYIAFNAFIDPAHLMPVFNDAMASFLDADGIVIDVRGNPGGIAPMAMGMAGWLIAEKDQYLGTLITRDNRLKVVVFSRPRTYSGPVAILVDGLSGSCSEMFAGGLQDLGRARIFGSRTVGAALPSVIEKLPNGDGFQYAFANYVSRRGAELEGVGVVPDVEVEPTRESLLAGRDVVLDAAVAWIRGQSRR